MIDILVRLTEERYYSLMKVMASLDFQRILLIRFFGICTQQQSWVQV